MLDKKCLPAYGSSSRFALGSPRSCGPLTPLEAAQAHVHTPGKGGTGSAPGQ